MRTLAALGLALAAVVLAAGLASAQSIRIYTPKDADFANLTEVESILGAAQRAGSVVAADLIASVGRYRADLERFRARALGLAGVEVTPEVAAQVEAHNDEALKAEADFKALLREEVIPCLNAAGLQVPSAVADLARTLADSKKYEPWEENGVTKTACNRFASDIAQAGFGYDGLRNLKANQIFDKIKSDPQWQRVVDPAAPSKDLAADLARAQQLANDGRLVLVAWRDGRKVADPHGHVAVVVPGRLEPSGAWKMSVPQIAQAGARVFAEGRMSDGFLSKQKTEIVISVWKAGNK